MATHAVVASFSSTGTMGTAGAGIKRKKAVGNTSVPISFGGTGSMNLNTSMITFSRAVTADFSSPNGTMEVDDSLVAILRSQFWWDKNWIYRRILQIQPNAEGFEVDHPLTAIVDKDLIMQGKLRSDAADLEVLHLVNQVPETWEILPKKVEVLDNYIVVSWPNHIEIGIDQTVTETYYIYYGNPDLVDQPDQIDYEPEDWPVVNSYTSDRLSWTRPGEHWVDGIAEEDGAKVTLEFYGSKVRVLSDIGPEWGIAEVQIDDEEWEQVDLHNPVALASDVVYERSGLSVATHTIRVRRSGFKSASATDYKINIRSIDYLRHNNAVNVKEEADETLMWGSVIGGVVGNKS